MLCFLNVVSRCSVSSKTPSDTLTITQSPTPTSESKDESMQKSSCYVYLADCAVQAFLIHTACDSRWFIQAALLIMYQQVFNSISAPSVLRRLAFKHTQSQKRQRGNTGCTVFGFVEGANIMIKVCDINSLAHFVWQLFEYVNNGND